MWEYVIPQFSAIIGDADRLPNGNTLIASGAGGSAGVVYEVTRKGKQAWRLELERPFFFYRAERIPELVVRTKRAQIAALLEAVAHVAKCRSRN